MSGLGMEAYGTLNYGASIRLPMFGSVAVCASFDCIVLYCIVVVPHPCLQRPFLSPDFSAETPLASSWHLAVCILYPAFCILHFASCILHPALYILFFRFCILHPAFYVLHLVSCILHTSCISHPWRASRRLLLAASSRHIAEKMKAGTIVTFVFICLGLLIFFVTLCCCWSRRRSSGGVRMVLGISGGWAIAVTLPLAVVEQIVLVIYALLKKRLFIALLRWLNGLLCAVLGGFAAYNAAALLPSHSRPQEHVAGWNRWAASCLISTIIVRNSQIPFILAVRTEC